MNRNFDEMIQLFSNEEGGRILKGGNFGLELESQRVTADGGLALTPHPAVFGSKIENSRITTDFSESQIEMVTPAFQTAEEVYASLDAIRREVENGVGDELLWPLSMPPRLPDEEMIPIARFDDTEEGREKEAYRIGLANRYGKKMQMISGIHYNFSFRDELVDFLYEKSGKDQIRSEFIDGLYFALTRNFLRYRWLLIYLFGASPACDATYYPVIQRELAVVRQCCPCCRSRIGDYTRHATSLRVSRFGYANEIQGKHSIFFNSLEEYTGKIRRMMEAGLLQKESEFYSPIRLKQNLRKGETQLSALTERGVKYVEVRTLDLDPFEPLGVSLRQLRFMQVFLLYCLMEEKRNIASRELKKINSNHHLTALFGRNKDLYLHDYDGGMVPLREAGERIFERLKQLAERMDRGTGDDRYLRTVGAEYRKLDEIALLPSERIFMEMKENKEDFRKFGIRRALENSTLELSTKVLIREALERGIQVEILDREDNFIRLQRGSRTEYVKQATRTSADSYIAPLIMENKEVTKLVLREHGINVPAGITALTEENALEKLHDFDGKDIVIKPKTTNFGKGVGILKKNRTQEEYKNAVKQAFIYDSSVMIEEFIEGREYRFLVIGDEVAAVLRRIPANVEGDGKHSIEELVVEKNKNPLRGKGYVTPLEKISLGFIEKEYLALQGKDFHTVPNKGETVFLRENSNISTGGDSIDHTDDVAESYKEIAVMAAKAVGAKICGADIIIRDVKEEPNAANYSIIELNFNPALHIHDYPYQGKNRMVEKKVLDLLGL